MEDKISGVDASSVIEVAKKISNWKTYVIYLLLALTVILGVICLWQRGSIANLKVDVTKMQGELDKAIIDRDLARNDLEVANGKIKNQNEAVSIANQKLTQMQKEMKYLQDKIDVLEEYREVERIKRQPTPQTCEEVLDFINKNI